MKAIDGQVGADHQYLGLLKKVSFQPVFILGDHRSGTTILYQALGLTQCFNIVTAYHIINYDQIIYNYVNKTADQQKKQLHALLEQKQVQNRGFDSLSATPDTPEEYGFILKNGGSRPRLRPDNLTNLIELAQKIQLTSDPNNLLLLKNPWDYFLNFMYVKEVFPNSKFIFVHRNPINVINSQLKTTRSLLKAKNEYVALVANWYNQIFHQPLKLKMVRFLFSSYFDMGLRIVTRHVASAANYFLANISLLPPEDYVCVRYEDLCQEPELTIATILDALGLKEKVKIDYQALIEVRANTLLGEVKRHQEVIVRRTKPYFDHFGYKLET